MSILYNKKGLRIIAFLISLCIFIGGIPLFAMAADADVSAVIAQIDEIGTVTYKSGALIKAAINAYDTLDTAQQKQVSNYITLTAAETDFQLIADGFNVSVTGWATNKYTRSVWMESANISEEDKQLSREAMADEMKYQYVENGYNLGRTAGTIAITNWSNYALGFEIVSTPSDNVGDMFKDGRYWAYVSTPFAGISFSENGYMSSTVYSSSSVPISNSFKYNGKVYQMTTAGIRSHDDIPLEKGKTVAITANNNSYKVGTIGSAADDPKTNNTFTFAYARYNQSHKWAGKTVGIPKAAVDPTELSASDVMYKEYIGPSGEAYIAGLMSYIKSTQAAEKRMGGNPVGAYVIAGDFLKVFNTLGADSAARFAVTGAPISDEFENQDGLCQSFVNGQIIINGDSMSWVARSPEAIDREIAAVVIALIDELPNADVIKISDKTAITVVQKAFDNLTENQQGYVTNADLLEALSAKIEKLEEKVKEIDEEILALPTADKLKISDIAKVSAVGTAYSLLTNEQKSLVIYYAHLKVLLGIIDKVNKSESLIEGLPDTPPDPLTDSYKTAAGIAYENYDELDYKHLVSEELADKLAAAVIALKKTPQEVSRAIGELPDLFTLTLNDEESIIKVKYDFDMLSEDEKAQVSNGEHLHDLVRDLKLLKSPSRGDVNSDGTVNVSDILLLRRVILENVRLTAAQKHGADINASGKINIKSIMGLRKIILG